MAAVDTNASWWMSLGRLRRLKETIVRQNATELKTMVQGADRNDVGSNRFTAEQISMTFNGVSLYYTLLKSRMRLNAIAADASARHHSGSKRKPQSAAPMNAISSTQVSNATKEYLRFMMRPTNTARGCRTAWLLVPVAEGLQPHEFGRGSEAGSVCRCVGFTVL